MRKLLIAGGIVVSAMAMPAQAQRTVQFTPGTNSVSANQRLLNQFIGTGGPRQEIGSNTFIYFQDTPGEAILPFAAGIGNTPGGNNGFASVLGGGSYTFNVAAVLGATAQVFSFLIGTLDTYNTVTLNFANGQSEIINGFAIAGMMSGNQAGGRVTYDMGGGPGISSVTFSSSETAFEFDDLAAAAPEPATWAMMILGFGLAGAALRRRRRNSAGTWVIA